MRPPAAGSPRRPAGTGSMRPAGEHEAARELATTTADEQLDENPVSSSSGVTPGQVSDRVLTLPNAISLARLLCVPVFALLILAGRDLGRPGGPAARRASATTSTALLARRWNQVTRLGQLLDPAADRLYVTAALLGLGWREVLPWWLVGRHRRPRARAQRSTSSSCAVTGCRRFRRTWWARPPPSSCWWPCPCCCWPRPPSRWPSSSARCAWAVRALGHRPVLVGGRGLPAADLGAGGPRPRRRGPHRGGVAVARSVVLVLVPADRDHAAPARPGLRRRGPPPREPSAGRARVGRTARSGRRRPVLPAEPARAPWRSWSPRSGGRLLGVVAAGRGRPAARPAAAGPGPGGARGRGRAADRRWPTASPTTTRELRQEIEAEQAAGIGEGAQQPAGRHRASWPWSTGAVPVDRRRGRRRCWTTPPGDQRRVGDGRPISDDGRVRDVDVQTVVNGLWAAGAEGIAVNGQRLTSLSTIRHAGDAIVVDLRQLARPYTITRGRRHRPRCWRRRAPARPGGTPPSCGTATVSRCRWQAADDLALPAASRLSLRHASGVARGRGPPGAGAAGGGGPVVIAILGLLLGVAVGHPPASRPSRRACSPTCRSPSSRRSTPCSAGSAR